MKKISLPEKFCHITVTTLLICMSACNQPAQPAKRVLSTEEQSAIAALKKLNAATEVGITYVEYGKLLIEAQDRVNYLKGTPNDAITRRIFYSMEAYKDARLAWKITIDSGDDYLLEFFNDDVKTLIRKYNLPKDAMVVDHGYPQLGTIRREVALATIWQHASCGLTLIDAQIRDAQTSDATRNVERATCEQIEKTREQIEK